MMHSEVKLIQSYIVNNLWRLKIDSIKSLFDNLKIGNIKERFRLALDFLVARTFVLIEYS